MVSYISRNTLQILLLWNDTLIAPLICIDQDVFLIITFKYTGSGLEIRSRYGCLQGFAIAGEDKKFHWALGELKDNRIVIWSPKVPNPVAVRYNWENNPDGNLYNKDGLPACLFRTDNW